jgi:hypothetical protein
MQGCSHVFFVFVTTDLMLCALSANAAACPGPGLLVLHNLSSAARLLLSSQSRVLRRWLVRTIKVLLRAGPELRAAKTAAAGDNLETETTIFKFSQSSGPPG